MTAEGLRAKFAQFAVALRESGLSADTGRMRAFATALTNAGPLTPFELYWFARLIVLSSMDDRARFDRVFRATWGEEMDDGEPPMPLDPPDRESRGSAPLDPEGPPSGSRERSTAVSGEDDDLKTGRDTADRVVSAVSAESLRRMDFADFSRDEWSLAQQLMEELPTVAERRRSRRARISSSGKRLDVGATIRSEMRTFGTRSSLRYRAPCERLRPVVFLCDVSGSMAPYGRAILQYAYVLVRARPRVAIYAFATRLTELTPALKAARSRAAFDAAMASVADWAGGTRIGASLRTFNRELADRGGARGATVVILSDGCEREDAVLVRDEMAALARLSHRIVWVNPLRRDPGYEPLTRGMMSALPYVDAFVDGHNLNSLRAVADAIAGATNDQRRTRS